MTRFHAGESSPNIQTSATANLRLSKWNPRGFWRNVKKTGNMILVGRRRAKIMERQYFTSTGEEK